MKVFGAFAPAALPFEEALLDVEEIQDAHLTAQERVLVRDLWNKFLPHDGMLARLFFERLLVLAPEVSDRFGQAAWRAPYVFLKLIDLSVRDLTPDAELQLKEGFSTAPSAYRSLCETIDDCIAFFSAFDLPPDVHGKAIEAFLWTCTKIPAIESFDLADLARGKDAAAANFFRASFVAPIISARREKASTLSPYVASRMKRGAENMIGRQHEAGSFFYGELFRRSPGVMRHFRTTDMDQLSRHLIDTVVLLSEVATDPDRMRSELGHLATVHLNYRIPSADYASLAEPLLDTLEAYGEPMTPDVRAGWITLFDQAVRLIAEPMVMQEWMIEEARRFFLQIGDELAWSSEQLEKRMAEVVREIEVTGSYTHTFEELDFGAKVAWRNAGKCVGRISWKNLIVRDCRHATDADTVFQECMEHLRTATNGGNIEVVLSAFRPQGPKERWGPRIWNSQLIRYAGYEREDGSVLGDRDNVELTKAISRLGWQPPETPGAYDILPLVIDMPGDTPRFYEIDKSEVLEVDIAHPNEPAVKELGLKWCAVPAIANFTLELGGLRYGCVPFNGWFMGTEIARDLWEPNRYDRAQDIADALGLDTSSEITLWRDRAFLELNVAILHSFQEAKVTLVDHHTASRQFLYHDIREKKAGRECPAQWSWIAPAAGGSTTQTWHHEMRDFQLTPSYEYGADRWLTFEEQAGQACPMHADHAGASPHARRQRPLILFASETGTAEAHARQIGRRLAHLGADVRAMDEISVDQLSGEARVLFVVATCRDGDVPENGRRFMEEIERDGSAMAGVKFAVLGLGNRIYPKFCAAAIRLDGGIEAAGGERLAALECADEIAGQSDTVRLWTDIFDKMWSVEGSRHRPKRKIIELLPPRSQQDVGQGDLGKVILNEELLGHSDGSVSSALRSTRRISIELPKSGEDGDTPRYAPGDHLAIHPENPFATVERVARHIDLPLDAWFRLHGSHDPVYAPYREGYSLKKLLSENLDLAIPAAPEELLHAMSSCSRESGDKAVLQAWLEALKGEEGDDRRREVLKKIRRNYHDVADLFDAFAHSVPGLEVLIDLLPRLKPRYYSIASSPLVTPDSVSVIAGVHRRRQEDDRIVYGVCSNYLAGLREGARLRVAVKPTPYRLPTARNVPLVLVAAGTGIAPILGMIEDRVARSLLSEPENPVSLYFGCRGEREFLCAQKILNWKGSGSLSRVLTAFSRETASKAYVQDAIDADGEQVWRDLQRSNAHVIVAGDAKMAQDVAHRLLVIAQREGGMSYSEARGFFDEMRASGRFVEDIWGLQLSHDLALAEIVQEKYNSGAKWFARLKRAFNREVAPSSAVRWY